MNVQMFCVGEIYDQWKNRTDGYIMEYAEEFGLSLHVFLNGITVHEREQFATEKPFEIRSVPIDGIMFFCLKFGNMDWADCAFSPNIYDEPPKFNELAKEQGLALNVLLIDSSMGQLLAVRLIGLGHQFSERFQAWCKASLQRSLTHDEYMKQIDSVYSRFSTVALAGMCHENDCYRLGQ